MAAPVFFGALAALAVLFTLRLIEERRGARLGASVRLSLDRFALSIKAILMYVAALMERIPQITSFLLRAFAVALVRRFAHMTEGISRAAHSAADMVSYKHRYERKETRSTFLKEVSRGNEAKENEENSNS